MYTTVRPQAGAGAAYRTIDLSSRIEAASPHRLIGILYEELLNAIGLVRTTLRQGGNVHAAAAHPRALNIISALESSLDANAAPDMTAALSRVYRETRRLLNDAASTRTPEPADQARTIIAEIALAWNAIG
ncbi:flagellar export chaperone FliS [Sphingomonas sp. 1P06PA]|uniref:flagellar export chaperone FliS n=1 Tax=Sphingomonas sp. 1P06PA TaxID=554121 RepID=UPI0039A71BD0